MKKSEYAIKKKEKFLRIGNSDTEINLIAVNRHDNSIS